MQKTLGKRSLFAFALCAFLATSTTFSTALASVVPSSSEQLPLQPVATLPDPILRAPGEDVDAFVACMNLAATCEGSSVEMRRAFLTPRPKSDLDRELQRNDAAGWLVVSLAILIGFLVNRAIYLKPIVTARIAEQCELTFGTPSQY